jgi:hypothetical protein
MSQEYYILGLCQVITQKQRESGMTMHLLLQMQIMSSDAICLLRKAWEVFPLKQTWYHVVDGTKWSMAEKLNRAILSQR